MDIGAGSISVALEMGKHISSMDSGDIPLQGKGVQIILVLSDGLRSIPAFAILYKIVYCIRVSGMVTKYPTAGKN